MKTGSLFIEGGLVNMSVVTFFGLLMLFFLIRKILMMVKRKEFNHRYLNLILLNGSLAFISALLIRVIGIYHALGAIAEAGDISTGLLAKGYQASLIAPIYGAIILITAIISWFILKEINMTRMK